MSGRTMGKLVQIDREALVAERRQVFDARTAEVLLRVLEKIIAQKREIGVTGEKGDELVRLWRR